MADRDKIEDGAPEEDLEESRALFLPKVEFESHHSKSYRLEEEFRKTKKNRSWFSFIILSALTLMFATGSFLLSRLITNRNRELQTEIRTFESINLREVFHIANQLQSSLDEAVAAQNVKEAELEQALVAIREQYANEISFIQRQGIPNEEIQRQVAQLTGRRDIELRNVRSEYETEIERYSELILDLRRQVNEYDSQQQEIARQQEELLNSERILRDLEVSKVSNEYEERFAEQTSMYTNLLYEKDEFIDVLTLESAQRLQTQEQELYTRYNPSFEDARIRDLLQNSDLSFHYQLPVSAPYSIPEYSATSYEDAIHHLQNTVILLEALRSVPYEGDVPVMLSQALLNSVEVFQLYENILSELSDALTTSNMKIRQYQHALNSYSLRNREDGYVIDSRDSQNIVLYIQPNIFVSVGQTLYIFRQATLVAVITIIQKLSNTEYIAALQESLEEIVTFDRILVNRRDDESINEGGDQ